MINYNNYIPILITTIIFLFASITSAQAQVQGHNDNQIWEQQRESIIIACVAQDMLQDLEGVYTSLEKTNTTGACTHDMLHLLGICEQNKDEHAFCKSTRTYIDEHNLQQLEERPEKLSQERIDLINKRDWNGDGIVTGSEFIEAPKK
ncbi:hypothetical protein BH18THE2_BH18THE2_17010 [soil metagenome]